MCSCEGKKTVGDRKTTQSIGIASKPPLRIRKWNQLSQFRWTFTKVIPTKKLKLDTFRQWAKGSKAEVSKVSTVLHIYFLGTRSTSPDITTVFHAWLYGRFIEIQGNLRRKKLNRTNQSSNFLGGSLEEKVNHSILKDEFFSRIDSSIHINSTSVISPVKQN